LIGSLETGKQADIVVRSTDSAELWPGIDPAHQLIAAGHGPTADTVIVNGRIVMRHGRAVLVDEAAVFAEARASALRVAKRLGMKPRYFSYPFGEFSPRVKAIAQSYGFEAIVNQNMGAVASFSDPLDLDRSALVGKSNLEGFLKYKALETTWFKPSVLLEDGKLTSLHVKAQTTSQKGGIYISEHGYFEVSLSDGVFEAQINKILTKERTRIIVSVGNKISTKLLVKDKYGTQ
jgi:hypothetical protein